MIDAKQPEHRKCPSRIMAADLTNAESTWVGLSGAGGYVSARGCAISPLAASSRGAQRVGQGNFNAIIQVSHPLVNISITIITGPSDVVALPRTAPTYSVRKADVGRSAGDITAAAAKVAAAFVIFRFY